MKNLIAAGLLITSTFATAATLEAPNNGGGKIVLTPRECVVKNETFDVLKEMYTTLPDGYIMRGCWALIDKKVRVIYIDGTERVYDTANFVYVE